MEDLAREVILKAIKDATRKPVKYPSAERPTARDKRQAMAFLLGRGEYEIWLKFWCMLANIDYGSVVKFGENINKGGENVRQIYSGNND